LPALLNWLKPVDKLFGQKNIHSIFAQPSQEEIKCTKSKQQLRSYCPNIYTVDKSGCSVSSSI
jgi:hypothetical protein